MKILLTMLPDDNDLLNLGIYQIAPMPCLALYTLSACLEKHGFDVDVLDAQQHEIELFDWNMESINEDESGVISCRSAWEDFLKKINFVSLNRIAPHYDIIGFSINSFNWKISRVAIQQVRRNYPDLTIIIGGIHATWLYEHLLDTTPIDYVVRGEGEVVFPELIRRLKMGSDLSSLNGIAYRDKNGKIVDPPFQPITIADLEETPLPAFHFLPEKSYAWIPLETSRGCLYSCKFCSIMFKGKWRPFPLTAVEERVKHTIKYCDKLVSANDYPNIYLVDDTFTVEQRRATAILEMLAGYRDKVRISLEARPDDLLNPALPSLLQSYHLGIVQIGADSGYRAGLKKIAKGASLKTVTDCAANIAKFGLSEWTSVSFIIGYPWEGLEECIQTLNFAVDLANRYGVRSSIKWLFPLPGSSIWKQRDKWHMEASPGFFDSFGLGFLDFFNQIYVGLQRKDYFRIQEYYGHLINVRTSVNADGSLILKKLVQFK